MAASKKNAKGNKTAHVLNLLTAPGASKEGAPAGEETESTEQAAPAAPARPLLPPILEVAQTNDDNLSQEIQRALEAELEEEAPAAPPAAEQPAHSIVEEVPPVAAELPTAEHTPAASGGKMSQEDIEKMLAGMAGGASEPEPPAPAPAPPSAASPSGGKMSQEDIEKMLAGMTGGASEPEPPAPAPAPPSAASPSGGKMSQEDIEKMLAGMAGGASEPEPPAPAPAPPSAPSPSGGKMSQEDIEKMLAGMAGEAPEPEPTPAPPAPVPAAPASDAEDDISYTNIMQTLVEEKAGKYIKMFGLCTCKHCEADVKALTLSNLVPKYVVFSKQDRIPMLTVYEGRYNSTITAQLTRACKVVMDHPHHGRTE